MTRVQDERLRRLPVVGREAAAAAVGGGETSMALMVIQIPVPRREPGNDATAAPANHESIILVWWSHQSLTLPPMVWMPSSDANFSFFAERENLWNAPLDGRFRRGLHLATDGGDAARWPINDAEGSACKALALD